MKNSSGTSLFQNMVVDSVAVEEKDAEEDEKRLQKELKEELEREFGDFNDISGSMDGSSYAASASGCYNNSNSVKVSKSQTSVNSSSICSINTSNDKYRRRSKDSYTNIEQLEVLYNVRLREIDQLRDEIEEMKKNSESERMELIQVVTQAQAEARKVTESRDEIQKVLVETTSRLRGTEKDLSDLKQNYSESELIKRDALHELEMCKMTVREQEQRLVVAERNSYKSNEANFDFILKELTLKHKQEINNLEKTINNLNVKFSSTEKECVKLKQKLEDQQISHRNALVKKSETIERLNATLIKCHSQYQQLLKNNKNDEVNRLLSQLQEKISENTLLRKEISSIKETLQEMKKGEYENQQQNSRSSDLELHLSASKQENCEQSAELERTNFILKTKERELENIQGKLEAAVEQCQVLSSTILSYQLDIDTLKRENESLSTQLTQAKKEQEVLKTTLMNYATRTDLLHQEQLSELEVECSKRILQLECQIKETENIIKERVSKIYSDEIDRIATEYMNHFDKLNDLIEKLRNELKLKMEEVSRCSEATEKSRLEWDKVYNKYLKARKIASKMKELAINRSQLLRRCSQQYVQLLKEIQMGLDDALTHDDGNKTEKITQLIEKSTKTICLDDILNNEELNRSLCDD